MRGPVIDIHAASFTVVDLGFHNLSFFWPLVGGLNPFGVHGLIKVVAVVLLAGDRFEDADGSLVAGVAAYDLLPEGFFLGRVGARWAPRGVGGHRGLGWERDHSDGMKINSTTDSWQS